MKLNSNIKIRPFSESINLLKVWLSVLTGKMLSRPISVNLLPTMACNSKCIMCDSWRIKEADPRIDLDLYSKLAAELKEMEVPYVTIGGGEPLIYKSIFELIKLFSQNGISVQLTTNGSSLGLETCKRLIDCGLNRLTVSIDSHLKDVYHRMRGVDWSEKVLGNIGECLKTYADQISIETNSVITEINVSTFVDTVMHFLKIGVNKICFSAVTISGENYLIGEKKDQLAKIADEEIRNLAKELLFIKRNYNHRIAASSQFIRGIKKYVKNPRKAVFPCYAGYLTSDILYNGKVYSCGNLPAIGDIKNSTFKDIWFSKEAMESRKAMARKKCPACYTSCKIELGLLGSPIRGIPYCFEKLQEIL